MYVWELLGHGTAEGLLSSGIGHELAPVMRAIEADLAKPAGFVAHVTEVVPRISVFHLGEVHVPTGREWFGRRTRSGGICWESRNSPVDPEVAYDLTALRGLALVDG